MVAEGLVEHLKFMRSWPLWRATAMEDEIFWEDRPVSGMSREELIEAIREMGQMIRAAMSPERIEANALGRVEMMRRGRR